MPRKKDDKMSVNGTPTQVLANKAIDNAIKADERLFILWYGGIRAGKTMGSVNGIMRHATKRKDALYILGGFTTRSVFTNIAPYFKKYAEEKDLKYKQVTGGTFPRLEIAGNIFGVYGADKAGRDRQVQGATAAGLLLDEYELLNREFVKQCEARISEHGALRIYTSNKDNPYNWAQKEYYQRAIKGEIDAIVLDANSEENQYLDPTFIEERKKEYDEYHRRRFIDNEFALTAPPLYAAQFAQPGDKTELISIYAYGADCVEIPFSYNGDKWVILDPVYYPPPYSVSNLTPNARYMVNATSPILARKIRQEGHEVIGYHTIFEERDIEICQRAFSDARVALIEGSELGLEYINTYNAPGIRNHGAIIALENGIRYLAFRERWL